MYSVNTTKGLNQIGGYVLSIFQTDNDEIDLDLSQYDLSGIRINAYILKQDALEFDEIKYQELLKEQEEEEKKREPTWQETIDSQVFYTAMMTDTLIEE